MSDGPSKKLGNKEQRVSSHVATEKRRRDRINKHFSDLRELVPHIDNKTDKASFLSEVRIRVASTNSSKVLTLPYCTASPSTSATAGAAHRQQDGQGLLPQ
jgi:hypothetical protein